MEPSEILETALRDALISSSPVVESVEIMQRIRQIASTQHALTRFILACALAKTHKPNVDARKPYTQINGTDAFSGRTYDQDYVADFIIAHDLPCNPTTAFLTPALRNHNRILTSDVILEGRPAALYRTALALLEDIQSARVSARDVLIELLRGLIQVRDEKRLRMTSLLSELSANSDITPLSAEAITTLLHQHLNLPHSSRLPVLMVAAAYEVAGATLLEHARQLHGHNAADRQTGAVGDVEIVITSDELVAAYEMKAQRVTRNDIDLALQKLQHHNLEHYVFITTELIELAVSDYAKSLYLTTGTEIAILNCISFVRHFLHFFHRKRTLYIDAYQRLLLAEPDSAVRQSLKEAWLAMRRASES